MLNLLCAKERIAPVVMVDAVADTGFKAKVFISYSRKDMAFADRLGTALKARGFEPLVAIGGAADMDGNAASTRCVEDDPNRTNVSSAAQIHRAQ
jgi:hypothetical protein